MDDALELLPADLWRYYLIANAPESDDTSFTWESLQVAVNKDLADTMGNFVNRSLSFTAKRFGAAVPEGGADGDAERELYDDLRVQVAAYTRELEGMEFRKAAATLRAIWSRGNAYFDRKAPWTTVKTDRDATAVTLRTSIALIALFARLSAPLLPATAERLLGALGLDLGPWPEGLDTGDAVPGAPFEIPPVLFAKITDEDVERWRERFGGHRAATSADLAPGADAA